jgi:AcrR family transcriptional regulator
MGEKSIQKKNYIIKKAREVFQKKGYLTVTMKDIVEACEISRGGLYLYFDNIKELFEAVLQAENEEGDDVFAPALSKAASSAQILQIFLREQKKELLRTKESLSEAIYEYFFQNTVSAKEHPLRQQFDMAVKIMERLIAGGVEEGDFVCDDPRGAARNIMYVLEGLRITSLTSGVTEEMINGEISYILVSALGLSL